jgi:hypothetical protein
VYFNARLAKIEQQAKPPVSGLEAAERLAALSPHLTTPFPTSAPDRPKDH